MGARARSSRFPSCSSPRCPTTASDGVGELAPPTIEVADTAGSLAHWLTDLGLVDVHADAVQRHLDLDARARVAPRARHGPARRRSPISTTTALVGVRERYLAAIAEREVRAVDVTTLIAVGRRPE